MDQKDKYTKPEYMNHPVISKYVRQLFLLTDDLHREMENQPVEDLVLSLKEVLRVVFARIAVDGELEELNHILHMHFPSEYDPPHSDSIPSLTEYPLSTIN